MWLVGAEPTSEIQSLAAEDVHVTGHISGVVGVWQSAYEHTHVIVFICTYFSFSYVLLRPRFISSRLAAAQLLRERGAPHQLIVTTSYDLALERAFLDASEAFDAVSYIAEGSNRGKICTLDPDGRVTLIERPNEYASELWLETRTVILKLHGQVDRTSDRAWESFVVTEDHYIEYLARAEVTTSSPSASLRSSAAISSSSARLVDWNLRLLLYRLWVTSRSGTGRGPSTTKPHPFELEFWRRKRPASMCWISRSSAASRRWRHTRDRDSGSDGLTEATLAAPPTPFKGLAPLGSPELDTLLFFGREREIEVIAANLVAATTHDPVRAQQRRQDVSFSALASSRGSSDTFFFLCASTDSSSP